MHLNENFRPGVVSFRLAQIGFFQRRRPTRQLATLNELSDSWCSFLLI